MKRKIWLLNLILVMVICIVLACSQIGKRRTPEINTDVLTPEIEIPAGGEAIDEQTVDSNEEASTESNADKTETKEKGGAGSDSEESGSRDESEDIVTPEF